MSTQIQPTPIVSGEKAKEIEELLKIEYSKDVERGKQVLKEKFEGKEKIMKEVKSVELRCDDRAENLVFTCDSYVGYDITIEDSYCVSRCNRFVRAWKAFWGKPIYYSGIYTEDKEKVRKWLLDCLKLVSDADYDSSH